MMSTYVGKPVKHPIKPTASGAGKVSQPMQAQPAGQQGPGDLSELTAPTYHLMAISNHSTFGHFLTIWESDKSSFGMVTI